MKADRRGGGRNKESYAAGTSGGKTEGVVQAGLRRGIRRYPALCLALALLLPLAGCSAVELEDRCFPMLAAVDYRVGQIAFAYGFPELSLKDDTDTDEAKVDAPAVLGRDFLSAVESCNGQLDRQADCNHLKVLVISGELLGQREAFSDMLRELRESELFPRNVYVCVTDDLTALRDAEPALPTDLGSYLEDFLMNHEKEHGGALVTLGTLLDETQNRSKTLYLPRLCAKDGAIRWEEDVTLDMTLF